MKTMKDGVIELDTNKTDWRLLREQKKDLLSIRQYLYDVARNKISHRLAEYEAGWMKSIDGIISFLDDIQHQAAEELGREVVFGKEAE